MKIHEVEQNSIEWHALRVGIVTASQFARVVTPVHCKVASAVDVLAAEIAGEILTGESASKFQGNDATNRGHELEPRAAKLYEMLKGNKTQKVGFVTNDEGTIGASPDRLVGEDGGLEIKCPETNQHLKYLLGIEDITKEHKPQIQGNIYVCERNWWDIMSYHPTLPPVIVRVEPDESYLSVLRPALVNLVAQIDKYVTKVKEQM